MLDNVYIYGLLCPVSIEVKYIGQSTKPSVMLGQHIAEAKAGVTEKDKWISGLVEAGQKPAMLIFGNYPHQLGPAFESHFITLHRETVFNKTLPKWSPPPEKLIVTDLLREIMRDLGRKGKGKPKNFSPEEIQRRTQRLAEWREKQTTKTKEEK